MKKKLDDGREICSFTILAIDCLEPIRRRISYQGINDDIMTIISFRIKTVIYI